MLAQFLLMDCLCAFPNDKMCVSAIGVREYVRHSSSLGILDGLGQHITHRAQYLISTQ